MAKTQVHVYSTLTSDVEYVVYGNGGDVPTAVKSVLIQGKVGIADRHLYTPLGMLTTISEDDYEAIKGIELFKLHVANGFIKVDGKKVDPEAAAADMNRNDPSAPMNPARMADVDVEVHSVGDVNVNTNDGGGKRKRKGE